jgi:hypothetical protein
MICYELHRRPHGFGYSEGRMGLLEELNSRVMYIMEPLSLMRGEGKKYHECGNLGCLRRAIPRGGSIT